MIMSKLKPVTLFVISSWVKVDASVMDSVRVTGIIWPGLIVVPL